MPDYSIGQELVQFGEGLPRTSFVASDYHLIARFLLTLYRWTGTGDGDGGHSRGPGDFLGGVASPC
jgi:hypothetical protein